jgi:hypothetical protein
MMGFVSSLNGLRMEAVFACAVRTSFAGPGLLEPCVRDTGWGLVDEGTQGGPLGLYPF